MSPFRTIVAVAALAGLAGASIATAAHAAPASKQSEMNAGELSAAKRKYRHNYVAHTGPRYSAYQRGSDPSLGPDGLPYRVPPHLRNQCYIDEGYGRFSACPNR